jgi:hypothetical protein
MPRRRKRELELSVLAVDKAGRQWAFDIHRSGTSYYLTPSGGQEHICNPSVTSLKYARSEVQLIYGVTITHERRPWGQDWSPVGGDDA